MNPFNFMARLLGRSAIPAPFVAGEALGALQSALEAGEPYALPPGLKVVSTPEYPEAERIAASIRDYPGDWGWARKGFDLIHVPSGFKLWVANEDYGLAEVHPNNGKTDFTKPEQAIIWPAVAEWLGHRKVGFTGRFPKAKIIGRGGTFWCFSETHPWAGVGCSPAAAYRIWRFAVSVEARADMTLNEYLQVRSATL